MSNSQTIQQIEARSERIRAAGDLLFTRVDVDVPADIGVDTTGESGLNLAEVSLSRQIQLLASDKDKVARLRDKARTWREVAQSVLARHVETFIVWALGLIPESHLSTTIKGKSPLGVYVEMPLSLALAESATALLEVLATESNLNILGDSKRKGKKAPRRTVFDQPLRETTSVEIDANTEVSTSKITVQHITMDGDAQNSKMRKFIELITKCANFRIKGDKANAGEIFLTLTDPSFSHLGFNFDDELISDIVTARVWASFSLLARKWAAELENAMKEGTAAKFSQRLEDLRVLAEAAGEVSKPSEPKPVDKASEPTASEPTETHAEKKARLLKANPANRPNATATTATVA
ncbi:MAG: hypothetical protein MN733_21320 [Nitrososphaera sp.]|nr:hypothetical protein [Nitrososphaera sp.]